MQSFPLGSSGSRSAINVKLGGRTQVVSLVQAVGAALVLLFLTGMLANLPEATLAALIVYAALGLLNIRGWIVLVRGSKVEAAIAATLTVGHAHHRAAAVARTRCAAVDPRRRPHQRSTARRGARVG